MTTLRAVHRGLVLASAGLLLAACGTAGDTGTDAGTDAGGQRSPSPTTGSPTGTPTPGTFPAYPHQDYTYTLAVACFCPDTDGQQIVVEDGKVVASAKQKPGVFGDLTINDIIAEANNTDYDQVEVDWPAGQDYPTSVSIDRIERAVDDEVTYEISDVVPTD